MRRWSTSIFLFVCVAQLAVNGWAQGSVGTLNGTVLDASGAVVSGAAVTATNDATGIQSKTTSTSAGAYTLPYLPAGTYTVTAAAPGFRVSTAKNVILRVAQDLTLNISLQVGGANQQVTVSDTPPLLDTGSAEVGRYVSLDEFKSWPIDVSDDGQRQIQSFIFSSLPGTEGGTFQGSINGGQEYSHEILIEGIPVGRSDLSGGNNNEFSPSAEAVGEFKLQTGAISAQYNGGQTAVANFTIKSGTNNLHGAAFYYNQNEALKAFSVAEKTNDALKGVQNPKKARFRENNEGFQVGGPVVIPGIYHGRNKTFWSVNYEKTAINDLGFSSRNATVPAKEFKAGDFSGLLNPAFTGDPKSGTVLGTDALGRQVLFGQIYDPKSTTCFSGCGTANEVDVRNPFPNNFIDPSKWDPVAKNIVQNIGIQDPLIDAARLNIPKISSCCPYFDLHIFGLKADHEINDKNKLSGYYNQSYRARNNNGGSRYLPIPGLPTSSWQRQVTPGHMVRLSLTSTLSPTLLNRVAAGYNRFRNENGADPSTVNGNWAQKIGLQNLPGTMFPVIKFCGASGCPGPPTLGGTIAQMGVGFVDDSPNGSYIYQDDLTWIHGAHTSHFGYQYNRYFYNDKSLDDAGSFTFLPTQTALPGFLTGTGYTFASFLLGGVDHASHGVTVLSQGFRQPQHAFYVTDDWKLSPRLTVNAGFRFELIPPFYETTNRMSEVNLTVPNPGANNLPGALVFAQNTPGMRFSNTTHEFGPRLGLAYQFSDKVVIRAGYAMTNTPPIRNDWGYGGFTYGYNGGVSVAEGTSPTKFFDDPSMYLSQPLPTVPPLPITDPASENAQSQVLTTAKGANRPGSVQNYNLSVQYLLPGQTVLEIAWVGNVGTRLWGACCGVFSELDGLPSSLLSMGDALVDDYSVHPELFPKLGCTSAQVTASPSTCWFANASSTIVSQALRPYPQYNGVEEAFPYNTGSTYNSLQVTATRHLTKGLGFLGAYTWSKAIAYVDANGPGAYYATVQDYANRKLERSVTTFYHPQNLKLTWVYDLPVGTNKRFDLGRVGNAVIGGWQLTAIQQYVSGDPIGIAQASFTIPTGFALGIRPDIVPGTPLTLGGAPTNVDVNNGTPYLNPAAFTFQPASLNFNIPTRPGTAPRILPNVRGPHNMNENIGVNKKFPFWREGTFFKVGATFFNAFNRSSRFIGTTFIDDPDFGKVFAGGGGRSVQLDGRIEF